MTDEPTPEDNKIIQLFTGEDSNWVSITHVKDDEQICPPDEVLKAQIGELKNVVVVGQLPSGGFMLASSLSRLADINYMVDAIKAKMVSIDLE